MSKVEVVKNVAEKLFAAEDAVDAAMVRNTQLLEAIIQGRRDLNVAATTAELAQTRVAEAIAALSEARRAVMAAHAGLKNVQHRLGVDDNEFGPADKPEDDRPQKPKVAPALRVAS